MISDLLFIGSTLAWCHKLELRTLGMYAAAVSLTYILKWLWEGGWWK